MRCVNSRDPIVESNRRIRLFRCDRHRGRNDRVRQEKTIESTGRAVARNDPQRGIERLSPDNALVRGHRRDSDPMRAL
ncbi:hypothetical protein [Lysobacter sp. Root690]|uniref:hypothetical protein n=1 Tax=Lysobacter sp. Root690 TaxID=1736588 RepID=UPI0006F71D8E|nr:hypothetical protein [Lysobacter sp. Root690]KRB02405.1 hypothetical protein ASD86_22940 [Lysobacter sp. Root690]